MREKDSDTKFWIEAGVNRLKSEIDGLAFDMEEKHQISVRDMILIRQAARDAHKRLIEQLKKEVY